MIWMLETLVATVFAGSVVAWAAVGRSGIRGRARVYAITGALSLFVKAAIVGSLARLAAELIADAEVRGEAPGWGLRLADTALGLTGGLLYAAGLAALGAALFVRHRGASGPAAEPGAGSAEVVAGR
jgi:hypothetical protein